MTKSVIGGSQDDRSKVFSGRALNSQRILSAFILLLISITWFYIFLRTTPVLGNDSQAFLQIGARVAQGDRLYLDVWDNKDPLTYWITSLYTYNYPLVAHLIELIWFGTISISAYFISRKFQISFRISLLAAWVLAPLAVLNLAYFSGSTEVPGLAVLIASVALAMQRRYVVAGILIGVLVFLKLIFTPIALALVLYWMWGQRENRIFLDLIAGFFVGIASITVLLIVRGELAGYVEMLNINILYSNAQLTDGSPMPLGDAFGGRLSLLSQHQLYGTLILALVFTAITGFFILRPRSGQLSTLRRAWFLSLLSWLGVSLVLLVTAKLAQHLLLFSLPIILISILTVSVIENSQKSLGKESTLRQTVISGSATLVLAILASGIVSPFDHKFLAESGWSRLSSEAQLSSTTKWIQMNPAQRDTSMAFLGNGTSVPVVGNQVPWNLNCRFIGQGPTDPEWMLTENLECISDSEIVIIEQGSSPYEGADVFNDYLSKALEVLERNFNCKEYLDIQVCQRK
jgi:hypothetical protein